MTYKNWTVGDVIKFCAKVEDFCEQYVEFLTLHDADIEKTELCTVECYRPDCNYSCINTADRDVVIKSVQDYHSASNDVKCSNLNAEKIYRTLVTMTSDTEGKASASYEVTEQDRTDYLDAVSASKPYDIVFCMTDSLATNSHAKVIENITITQPTHLDCVDNICTRVTGAGTDICTNEGNVCVLPPTSYKEHRYHFKVSNIYPLWYVNKILKPTANLLSGVISTLTKDYMIDRIEFNSNTYILTVVVKPVESLNMKALAIFVIPVIVYYIAVVIVELLIGIGIFLWAIGREDVPENPTPIIKRSITLKWKVCSSYDQDKKCILTNVNPDDIINILYNIVGDEIPLTVTGKNEIEFKVNHNGAFKILINASLSNKTPYGVSNGGVIDIKEGNIDVLEDNIIFYLTQPGFDPNPIPVNVKCDNTQYVILYPNGSLGPNGNIKCKNLVCTEEDIKEIKALQDKALSPGIYSILITPPMSTSEDIDCGATTLIKYKIGSGENPPIPTIEITNCSVSKNKLKIYGYYISKTPELVDIINYEVFVNTIKTKVTFDDKYGYITGLEPDTDYKISLTHPEYTFKEVKDIKFSLTEDDCIHPKYCCIMENESFVADTPISTYDIKIRVIDSKTEKVVKDAKVKIGTIERITQTDGETLSINGLKAGEYKGTITHVLYKDTTFTINVSKNEIISIEVDTQTLLYDYGKIDSVTHKIERASIIGGDDEIFITVLFTNKSDEEYCYMIEIYDENSIYVDSAPSLCTSVKPGKQGQIEIDSNFAGWSLQSLGKSYTVKLYTCKLICTTKDKFVDKQPKEFTKEELNPCCMNLPLIGCISQETCKTLKWAGIGIVALTIGYTIYKMLPRRN